MANLQQQFGKFHKTIKVEKEELREKRNIIVNTIKKSLKDKGLPVPEVLNQGSYIYGVGIKPISNRDDYDIDVGLVFDIKSEDSSPTTVRKLVFDAIKDHTNTVEEKGPCIRVKYEAGHHVDLVIYARHRYSDGYETFQLAHKDGTWKDADPKELKAYIKNAREPFGYTKDNGGVDQLQRAVRYLKRQNDKNLSDESKDKPSGLAILLLTIKYLVNPVLDSDGDPDDLNALRKVTSSIKNLDRISLKKPTPEYEDVFRKISIQGMARLIETFKKLDESLYDALNEPNLEEACKILQNEFGDDFPIEQDKEKSAMASLTIPTTEATRPYAH